VLSNKYTNSNNVLVEFPEIIAEAIKLKQQLILKEKEFREALKTIDLNQYTNKSVAVTCSADAVIPIWAYMLVASYLQPIASDVAFGLLNIEINPENL
jgi:hypothetical protein